MDNNTKTGISPSTLGRERKRYLEMSALDGVTKKQVLAQMKLDAKRYAKKLSKDISFEDYKADIETLPKSSNTGKREADKVTRDELITQTQDFNAVANLAIQSQRSEVSLTDEQKVIAFDEMGKRGDILAHHLTTAFDGVKALTMIHAPDDLLCVHIAGWEDGSKNYRFQYAPRKLPITKRSGYRDDSFTAPVFEIAPAPAPKAEPKVSKAKAKATPAPVTGDSPDHDTRDSEGQQ